MKQVSKNIAAEKKGRLKKGATKKNALKKGATKKVAQKKVAPKKGAVVKSKIPLEEDGEDQSVLSTISGVSTDIRRKRTREAEEEGRDLEKRRKGQ